MIGTDHLEMSTGDGDAVPSITLFVKRSPLTNDMNCHRSACIICQKWFMALHTKSQCRHISLEILAINAKTCLPEEHKNRSISHLPCLLIRWPQSWNSNNKNSSNDGIVSNLNCSISVSPTDGWNEQHLFDSKEIEAAVVNMPGPSLVSEPEARKTIADVYMRFSALLRSDSLMAESRANSLLTELYRIDKYLLENCSDHEYLCGDSLTLADCDVLPKLQHIRIAGEFYKDFFIPESMKHIWRYLNNAYSNPAFMDTCPFDQDILMHYETKVIHGKQKLCRPTLQKLHISSTIAPLDG